jgi:hypothetical protein
MDAPLCLASLGACLGESFPQESFPQAQPEIEQENFESYPQEIAPPAGPAAEDARGYLLPLLRPPHFNRNGSIDPAQKQKRGSILSNPEVMTLRIDTCVPKEHREFDAQGREPHRIRFVPRPTKKRGPVLVGRTSSHAIGSKTGR